MLKNKKIAKSTKIFCTLVIIILFGVCIKGFLGHQHTSENYDVDLVYLWCDGNDPNFQEQKNYWLIQENKQPDYQATAAGRFEQVDELKYSLRSVEKYLPWVRHVYLVTAGQIPTWLNTKNPKLTVVDHTEILPKENLPVFNSNAIEAGIYKIPGLSEHFLYANDDTFVNRPLTKDFFFEKGKPIVRMKSTKLDPSSLYQAQILSVIDLSENAFSSEIPFFSKRDLAPHHNIDAYLKSDYADCVHHFAKEYQETLTHRFRKVTSIQRLIVSIWSVMKNHAQVKVIYISKRKPQGVDSLYMVNTKKNYAKQLNRLNPALFCINDSEFSKRKDRMRLKKFLKKRFPKKSKFEW